MFPILRVDRRASEAAETLGTKPKFWFTSHGRRMLFKAEERGTGEDWAEKIACHLCELLGLPHVHYELAEEYDERQYIRPGVICENCAPPPLALVLGNELLLERDPSYPAQETRKYNHENWAALRGDTMRLAPTYDHGASLARQITDEERKERLETKDQNRGVAFFARKARSAFYGDPSDSRALGTLEAYRAFANLSTAAATAWQDRLAAVGRPDVQLLVAEVPNRRMSGITKEFTVELLEENKRRLLEGRGV